jgi:hypothetical protein
MARKPTTIIIKRMAITTTKPTKTIQAIEKVLRKYAGKDWYYHFDLE